MKFMTAGTVRNLPNYLQEDRQRELMNTAKADKEKAETEKKLLVQFGLDIQDAADKSKDPDTLNQALGEIRGKYKAMGMTPDMMQMGANLARQFKQDFLAGQDRQERKDDRNMLLAEKNQAKSDVNLLGQIASGKYKSYGAEGYEVPGSEDAARSGLSGEGQLRLIDIMNKKEDRTLSQEDRLLRNRLLNAQIAKTGKEDKRTQAVQGEDGIWRVIDLDSGNVINTGLKGKNNKDFTQASAKIGILDKKRNNILKKYDDDETFLIEKAKSGDATAIKDMADYQKYSQESDNLTQKILGGESKPVDTTENKNPSTLFDQVFDKATKNNPDKKNDQKPEAILSPAKPPEITTAQPTYRDAKIFSGYVWATGEDGKARRLFKVETPEVKYGERVYPNKDYPEYLKKLESLGIK